MLEVEVDEARAAARVANALLAALLLAMLWLDEFVEEEEEEEELEEEEEPTDPSVEPLLNLTGEDVAASGSLSAKRWPTAPLGLILASPRPVS
jgi:hypothetical protein